MICFLTTRGYGFALPALLGDATAPHISTLSYDRVLKKSTLPKATYVFTDIDRLNTKRSDQGSAPLPPIAGEGLPGSQRSGARAYALSVATRPLPGGNSIRSTHISLKKIPRRTGFQSSSAWPMDTTAR